MKVDTTIPCSTYGNTPLDIAIKDKNIDCIILLYKNQVEKEINCKNAAKGELCPICMEEMDDDIYVTRCFHVFHEECWNMYLSKRDENKNICPMCRKKP